MKEEYKNMKNNIKNDTKNNLKKTVPVWLPGLIIGILLLLIGYYHNQFTEFYRKAVMICLECIGIG